MDVFAILKAEQVEALIGAAKPVSFKAGDAVSSRGSSGTSALWIIIDGFVTITRPDAKDASKAEVLGRLGCGEHFGAKNDPSFKDILSRIATTLSSSLG